MWSATAQSVWGKLDPDAGSWMPLVTHLEHASTVAVFIWDSFLPESLKALLVEDLDAQDEEVLALCSWYAGIHDVGKASVSFASQAEGRGMTHVLARMRDLGLPTIPVSRVENVRHETVGQQALRDWLVEVWGARPRLANSWACVIGGHHGRNPSASDLMAAVGRPHVVGAGRWADVRREILGVMAERTGAARYLSEWIQRPLPVRAQALLTAIVVVADWLASNQEYFPYHDELPPSERSRLAFAELALPSPWRPRLPDSDPDALLRERFPWLREARARPVQIALLAAASTCDGAPLLIVEAPMGVGKTEAALMASEVIAARFGQGGLYVGLPTMATANPMFDRVRAWLETSLGTSDASIALAHGKAGLNDTYAGLLRDSWRGQVYDEGDPTRGRPVVNGWLRGRRKANLASFVVGTVDQGLFAALKAKHVALRHFGLAGKVVIVDEVHAADAYMREYLKRTLAWLGAYRTPVILMSATLPPAQRDEYVAAYAGGRGDLDPGCTDRCDTYPRVTVYDGVLADVSVPTEHAQAEVLVERLPDDLDDLRELLKVRLSAGGCAGVICNTVARAQEAFRVLRQEFSADVVLLHSRFIAPDRALRERRLIAQLGPEGARPGRLVVVGTQVLEQSLDIDLDVMVSDLAPADLLLQRIGRLHRHRRTGRPDGVACPVVHLRGVLDWTGTPPVAVKGSSRVYGDSSLLRAAAVLSGRDRLSLPGDIPMLVRQAYDPDLPSPVGWETRWIEAEHQSASDSMRSKQRAQSYLLADPAEPVDLTGWIDVVADEPDRSEEQGRSQVRDSEDSLEVIALWRDEDGSLHLPSCAPEHPGALIPEGLEWGTGSEQRLAREMASCTLSLPIQLTNPAVIDRVIAELERTADYSGWQQSPWIKGQLVVVFGPDDCAFLAGFELHYSPDEGLVVTRTEEKP